MTALTAYILKRKTYLKHVQNQGDQMWGTRAALCAPSGGGPPTADDPSWPPRCAGPRGAGLGYLEKWIFYSC